MKKPCTHVLAFLATIGLFAVATPTASANGDNQATAAVRTTQTTATTQARVSNPSQPAVPVTKTATQETTEYSERQLVSSPDQAPARPLGKQNDQAKVNESLGTTIQPRAPVGGQDASRNITDIEVNNGGELYPGNTVNVKIHFDEHSQKIHQGDTITVKWPNSGTTFGNGYIKKIPLTINGVSGSVSNGAELEVKDDCAVIRFTHPLIERLKNIKGWAMFSVKANNSSKKETGFSISGGDKTSQPITVKGVTNSGSPQGETVFYDKRGDMQPNDTDHVRWFLCVNNNRKPVTGPIQIEDQIQPGQRLDLTSFMFYVDGDGSSLSDFLKNNPTVHFEADEKRGHLSITLPEKLISGKSLKIWYKTIIEDYNQSTFDNQSTITYQEKGKPAVTESHNRYTDHSVNNVIIDGAASGDNNRVMVQVKKVWKDDQPGDRPKAVQVQLYANDNPSGDPVVLSADNDWSYLWSNLLAEVKANEPITYSVQEVNVPAGYESTVTGKDNAFTITNTLLPVSLEVSKVWKDNDNQDGKRPKSVTVELLADDQLTDKLVTLNASNGWKGTITGLAKYANGKLINYSWQEKDVPAGYEAIVDGNTITNTHTPEKTTITVKKVWDDHDNYTNLRPQKIAVQVLKDGDLLRKIILDADHGWQATLQDLPVYANGKEIVYTVTEKDVPTGYVSEISGFTITNHLKAVPVVPHGDTPEKTPEEPKTPETPVKEPEEPKTPETPVKEPEEPKTPETPVKEPEEPKTPETPVKEPEEPKTPETPVKEPEEPKTPETPVKEPEEPKTPETPAKEPEEPKTPETPAKEPEEPKTPEIPVKEPEEPKTPETPAKEPEEPKTPETPVKEPEEPKTPETPVEKPEEPKTPETPVKTPEEPKTPDTPAEKPEEPVQPTQPEVPTVIEPNVEDAQVGQNKDEGSESGLPQTGNTHSWGLLLLGLVAFELALVFLPKQHSNC